MRCDQCAHWPAEQEGWNSQPQRECGAISERHRIEDNARAVALSAGLIREDVWNSEKAALAEAIAYTQDGSDYVSSLYTRADFFCALFKQKDPS